jgi:hypothetical protein
MILLNGSFTAIQRQALDAYLVEHRKEYTQQQGLAGPMLVRNRDAAAPASAPVIRPSQPAAPRPAAPQPAVPTPRPR